MAESITHLTDVRNLRRAFPRPAKPPVPVRGLQFGDRVIWQVRGRIYRGHIELTTVGTKGCAAARIYDGPDKGRLHVKPLCDFVHHLGSFK